MLPRPPPDLLNIGQERLLGLHRGHDSHHAAEPPQKARAKSHGLRQRRPCRRESSPCAFGGGRTALSYRMKCPIPTSAPATCSKSSAPETPIWSFSSTSTGCVSRRNAGAGGRIGRGQKYAPAPSGRSRQAFEGTIYYEGREISGLADCGTGRFSEPRNWVRLADSLPAAGIYGAGERDDAVADPGRTHGAAASESRGEVG